MGQIVQGCRFHIFIYRNANETTHHVSANSVKTSSCFLCFKQGMYVRMCICMGREGSGGALMFTYVHKLYMHTHMHAYSQYVHVTMTQCLLQLEHTHQALIMFAGHSSAYFCFGRLLFAFVRGWEDYEKIKAYNLILTIAKYVRTYVCACICSAHSNSQSPANFGICTVNFLCMESISTALYSILHWHESYQSQGQILSSSPPNHSSVYSSHF